MSFLPRRGALLVTLALAIALIIVIVIVADKVDRSHSPKVSSLINSNSDVNSGSSARNIPAPDFTLLDQQGHATTLSQFRGKVVVLAFIDAHCTTICPLMTEGMVQALKLLGPAAARVQLLGIDANPLAIKVADVAAYTRAHQMQGKWRFLTGTMNQLKAVWHDYHVYVAATHSDIDHQPLTILIGPNGRERTIFFTQMSYEGIAQQAQVLADSIARLLPGHPAVHKEISLQQIPSLKPDDTVRLSSLSINPQTVVLGPGHPHLILFFANWLDEDVNFPAKLTGLNAYAAAASQRKWPSPVLVNEPSTESRSDSERTQLNRLAAMLKVPIVEDKQGRLADGYDIQDLPWYTFTSDSGTILWHHDGWLSEDSLEHKVQSALALR